MSLYLIYTYLDFPLPVVFKDILAFGTGCLQITNETVGKSPTDLCCQITNNIDCLLVICIHLLVIRITCVGSMTTVLVICLPIFLQITK